MASASKPAAKKVVEPLKEETVKLYRTPSYWNLFDAIGTGSEEGVIEVLQQTHNPRALLMKKDLQGLTPLKKAVALNKSVIAQILVSFGAEPSVRDPLERTVLHVAAMQGRRELLAPLLVSSDSSVNVQDNDGWTPLHLAVRGHHEKVINWLLYAGADVTLKNKNDMTPLDLCEADSPIHQMLEKQAYNLDECPVELCSAYIGPKQLNMIGSEGSLMFVTSGLWSEDMQFFFNVRTRPYFASPAIPLRQDEMFFGDACRYRMMFRLPPGQSRVHAYFLSFEYFRPSEVILKITSKSNFLGEVPVALSSYTQDNFTCFLASAEIELKDAGQFVLVSRPTPVLLTKGKDGVYSNIQHKMFKFDLVPNALPGPPLNWEAGRESRARAETEILLRKLEELATHSIADENKNADSETAGAEDSAGKRDSANDDPEGTWDEESEEAARAARRPVILDGDEPDDCQDFYYISKGYGLFLEYRETLPLPHLLDKVSQERNVVSCATDFYIVSHSSGQQLKHKCRVQIPKSRAFVKVGTVLVFMREELKPDEVEFPDPDDQVDEHFLSEDGKNVWGIYWLNKERERWSVLPSGIVNKRTRVIFETTKLSTFIVIQLRSGSQKWEAESGDEVSSDEESEKEKPTNYVEKVEGEGEEDAGQKGSASSLPASAKESEKEVVAKKRKSTVPTAMMVDYGDDDVSEEEEADNWPVEEAGSATVETLPVNTKQSVGPATAEEQAKEQKDAAAVPQSHQSAAQVNPASDQDKKNDNASNVHGQNTANTNQNKLERHGRDNNNNAEKRRRRDGNRNRSNIEQYDDENNDSLTIEEKTVVKNLEPAGSNYALVVGVPYKPIAPAPPPSEEATEDKEEEPVVEEDVGQEDEDKESDEDIPVVLDRQLSIARSIDGKTVLQPYKFGPPLTELNINEQDDTFIKNGIALMWRYRNHKEVTVAVFSRPRDVGYDMIIEIVRTDNLYVRAEHWWSQDYKMVSESGNFPLKSGRLFSFAMDGTMLVENPPGSTIGYIVTRTAYCYLSQINSLQYFVKRGIAAKEDDKGPKKGVKKKDDQKVEHAEPDAILEVTGYPRGTRTNGQDVAVVPIFLTGPDLWYDRHVELRKSDNIILSRLVKFLRKDSELVKRWWKVILMLGYSEKMVEAEKGKNKSSIILATFLKKWFDDNLNALDRGILALITILNTLGLKATISGAVNIIKEYKGHLLNVRQRPRYLKLLFHWIIQTKITQNSLVRMIGPQIMRPVSDVFLLRLSELLNPDQLYKIGASMDVEDNVLHAIAAEEVITDPEYLLFRVFIKSRQKKDEIIHYTLLLIHMAKQCEQPEAKNFVVNETKKWMETVADTEPEICAKLHNVFD